MSSQGHQTEEVSRTREAILDATIEIMREEGYAAVSSRKVSARAGLKSKLVHYYFRTMDDLFLAAYQREDQKHFSRHVEALTSNEPLRALWELTTDSSDTALTLELVALANHRKAIREALAQASERIRIVQAAAFTRVIGELNLNNEEIPPLFLSLLMTGLSRIVAMDNVLGVSAGHEETFAFIDKLLGRIAERPSSP